MAETPERRLRFTGGCPDCGERLVRLPDPAPDIPDDFDWWARDYDGFRLFMLEELAARFPERKDWSPADMEVVLVETLAVVLDQLSDLNDRVYAESFLETARRPDTVRRLLRMIGYDPLVFETQARNDAELDRLWLRYPERMERARRVGVDSLRQQRRIVTLEDYRDRLRTHPLVADARAFSTWSGAWPVHEVVVLLKEGWTLDDPIVSEGSGGIDSGRLAAYEARLDRWYREQGVPEEERQSVEGSTPRQLLQSFIERERMVGQAVVLRDVERIGVDLSLSISVGAHHFRSEVREAVREVLLGEPGGFFSDERVRIGEDLLASDLITLLSSVDGVEGVCINRMKRVGSGFGDRSGSGRLVVQRHQAAVLESDSTRPERGMLRLSLHGGMSG